MGSDTTMTMTVGGVTTGPFTQSDLERATKELRRQQGKPKMKRDTDFENAGAKAQGVAGEELRQFIERFERLEAEKQDIVEGQKEVMAEAKGRGYDTKVIRKVIALRKRDADDVAEEEAVLEMYKAALGM